LGSHFFTVRGFLILKQALPLPDESIKLGLGVGAFAVVFIFVILRKLELLCSL